MNTATNDRPVGDTDALNSLLRSEMTAVEIYTHALGQFDDQLVIADLQRIRDEHSRAVRELRDHVVRTGGRPTDGIESDEMSTTALHRGENEISPATVLAALRQREEYGLCEYEAALESEAMHPDCERTIRTDLLTACRNHVEKLNRLLGGMNR